VRIIGGRWRGRKLAIAEPAVVRPTPNRARETLFNWLAPVIEGASCIDLYAGTGALGFEALSRGAQHVCFLERDPVLAAALRERAMQLGAGHEQVRVIEGPVERFLSRTPASRFDIGFLDPPYSLDIAPVLAQLGPWLSPAALIYVERSARGAKLADALDGVATIVKESRAGAVAYGLARLSPEALTPAIDEG